MAARIAVGTFPVPWAVPEAVSYRWEFPVTELPGTEAEGKGGLDFRVLALD